MNVSIKGIERPSGETYSLEECRNRNRFIRKTVDDMVMIAEEVAQRENLHGTIFILNTTGSTRDDFGIGFEYPEDERIAEVLNRTFSAQCFKDWAQNLPAEQREVYLGEIRRKGYEGYL